MYIVSAYIDLLTALHINVRQNCCMNHMISIPVSTVLFLDVVSNFQKRTLHTKSFFLFILNLFRICNDWDVCCNFRNAPETKDLYFLSLFSVCVCCFYPQSLQDAGLSVLVLECCCRNDYYSGY